ncbi:Fcf1-domain-containing protein [Baffinella frigidus]|nr:Fcf1-domain-containing protein [Cryptophyta sp. CCMP2293]|mmetsp:Transcript_19948/g.48348  ORF Transcript_19948/g.48348 Transcript_19948/m.48348 type:complete len:147 (+) Transcript_19948:452-892(+)
MNSKKKHIHKISIQNYFNNSPKIILVDTNFAYFALKNKIDLFLGIAKCISSEFIICISKCVLLELEKLGPKFRLALRLLRQKKIIQLVCLHPPTIIYADDCLFNSIKIKKNIILATCDKDLRKRVWKISAMPILSIKKKNFVLLNK